MPVFTQVSHAVIVIAAFLSILAGFKYFQYRTPTTRWGGMYLFSLALEIISFSLVVVSEKSSSAIAWYILQVVSFYFLCLFWLLFIAETAGLLKKIAPRYILPLLCIPPIVQAFLLGRMAANPPSTGAGLENLGSLARLPLFSGSFGWVMIFLFYAMGTLSLILLARLSIKSNHVYLKLFLPMLIGNISIFSLDIIDRAGFSLFDSSYLIQFGLAFFGVSIFFSAYIWRFGGILPISRESIFDGIHDGVIILDYYDRVVDINPAALKYLGVEKKTVLNQALSRFWEAGAKFISERPGDLWIEEKCSLTVNGQAFVFGVNIFQKLGLNNSPNGRVILLRNDSRSDHMERALEIRSRELQRTNNLLETLASLSIDVQPEVNAAIDYDIVGMRLQKLGLVYFVAELDPPSGELVMRHISALPETIFWIERTLRNKIVGFRLDKEQFSALYQNLGKGKIIFKRFEPEEMGIGVGKIPTKILARILAAVGLHPQDAILVLPLVSSRRPLGIMGVWGQDLKEADVPAFQVFASQVAHKMEQAIYRDTRERQAAELERSNRLMIALSEAASIIGTAANPEEVMDALGAELKKVDLDCAVISFSEDYESAFIRYSSVNPESRRLFSKWTGVKLENLAIPSRFWPDDRMIKDRAPAWYDDLPQVVRALFPGMSETVKGKISAALFDKTNASLCVIPFASGDQITGALAFWGRGLQRHDSPLLNVFSHQVEGILRNLMDLESEVQRSGELTRSRDMILALTNVVSRLDEAGGLQELFSILGNELKKIGLMSMIGTLENNDQDLRVKYVSVLGNLRKWAKELGSIWPDEVVIPRRYWPTPIVTDEKKPYWDPDPVTSIGGVFPGMPRIFFEKVFQNAGPKKAVQACYLPVISKDHSIGIFAVWGEKLYKEDIQVLMLFSNQVAGIIERLNIYEEEVRRSKQLLHTNGMVIALSNVAAQLDSTSDTRRIFEILGTELRKVHIHCMVGTLDDLKQNLKVEYLSNIEEITARARKLRFIGPDEINIPRRLWPSEKVVSEKTPYWDPEPIGSVHKMLPFVPANIFLKVFSMVGFNPDDPVCYFPMIIDEDVIGILAVWGPDLNPDDLTGFSVFANQLATAIKTTRLYALAQKEILERTTAEEQIRAALDEKEILLKEIHHRVKNNLQIITSLLSLQAAEVTDEKTQEALRESQNRLRSMALIHEKLYQSHDLARIDFSAYIESLVSSLSQTYRVRTDKIAFKVRSEALTLNIDIAIPCGLIINELVSNCVKYAFPGDRKGEIRVGLQRNSGKTWTLAVTDDGVGLPPGFEIDQSPSLGLNLVKNLVRQINGRYEIDRAVGTSFRVYFEVE